MDSRFDTGVRLFNQQRFFEAHEALEDAWRETQGEARLFVQGLTQAAVALHHYSTGNRAGATSVLARALRNLSPYPDRHGGIDLESLRVQLRQFHAKLLKGTDPESVPRIEASRAVPDERP